MQVIYKCSDCKTIFTAANVLGMLEFEGVISSNPIFKRTCYLGSKNSSVCTSTSYSNMTGVFYGQRNLTDSQVQSYVSGVASNSTRLS